MVNAIEYLLNQQIIVEQQGRWELQIELDEVELGVPENIRFLIEKQIERLDNEDRRVLEGASIVGMDCSAVAISAGTGEDVVKIEEICDRLARHHQFLMPAYLARLPDGTITPRYRFIHVLYLDVLYKQVGSRAAPESTSESASAARKFTAFASVKLRRNWRCILNRGATGREPSGICGSPPKTPPADSLFMKRSPLLSEDLNC
jgi:hypothetical protein